MWDNAERCSQQRSSGSSSVSGRTIVPKDSRTTVQLESKENATHIYIGSEII